MEKARHILERASAPCDPVARRKPSLTSESNDFARFERESWERVASHYETAWSGLTRPFIPHLLEATQVTKGTRLLDVACGAAPGTWPRPPSR